MASFQTRTLTQDKSPWYLKSNFKTSWRTYLLAAIAPDVTIFFGAWLYFLLFPQDLDLAVRNLVAQYSQFGAPENLQLTSATVFGVEIAFIFISPLVLSVHFFALGDEIGWRGYLLPIFLKLIGQHKAVVLRGLLWGLSPPSPSWGFGYMCR